MWKKCDSELMSLNRATLIPMIIMIIITYYSRAVIVGAKRKNKFENKHSSTQKSVSLIRTSNNYN